jgi:O-antigen ligase
MGDRAFVVSAVMVVAVVAGLTATVQPAIGLAGAVVAACCWYAWSRPVFGLAMVSFASFVALVPAQILPAVTLVKAFALLFVVVWLLQRGRSQSGRVPPAFMFSLTAFAGWTTLSLVWATDLSAGLDVVSRLAQLIVTATVGIAVMRRRDDAMLVAAAFVAGAAVAAGMGLATGIGSQQGRLAGTVGDANELAIALVAAIALIPPLYARARARHAPVTAAVVVLGGAVALTGLVMTGSRGGSISLMAAAAVAIVLGRRWWSWAIPVLGLGTVAAIVIASGAALPSPASHLSDSNTSNRTTLWTLAWRMTTANPFTGVGVGNFVTESPAYLVQPGAISRSDLVIDQRKVAHNTYLQLSAEGGAPALVSFVAMLGIAGACGIGAAQRFARAGEHDMAFLAQAFVIGLAGISVGAFFLTLEVNKQLWLVAAVCVGLYRIVTTPRSEPHVRGPLGNLSAGRLAEVGP